MKRLIIPTFLFILPLGFFLFLQFFGENEYKIPVYHPADHPVHISYKVSTALHPYLSKNHQTLVGFLDDIAVIPVLLDKLLAQEKILVLHKKWNLKAILIVSIEKQQLIQSCLAIHQKKISIPYTIVSFAKEKFQQLRRSILLQTTQKNTLALIDHQQQIRGYYHFPYRSKAIRQLIAEVHLLNKQNHIAYN